MTLAQIKKVMAQVHERRYGKVATNQEISECHVTGMQVTNIGGVEHYILSLLWPTWRGDFRVHFVNEGSCVILDITRPRI